MTSQEVKVAKANRRYIRKRKEYIRGKMCEHHKDTKATVVMHLIRPENMREILDESLWHLYCQKCWKFQMSRMGVERACGE